MARWHFCNILRYGKEKRQLWQFLAANRKFSLQKEESKLAAEPLTSKLYAKDWENLVQPRLNVAWLPAEHVFLRIVQLPRANESETRSMLDLQLEKLSPIPVGQVVWSYQSLATTTTDMQTVVVIIVARQVVEAHLKDLESLDFLADRLELPFLDQLSADYLHKDGVWVFAGWGTDPHACLVAWRQGGELRSLTLVHLPQETNRAEVFRSQLNQMTWTAELEGWMTESLPCFLVAEPEIAPAWQALFEDPHQVSLVPPIPTGDLALLTARRVAADSLHTNLLPEGYAARYKQQFVDRLWIRGLGAVAAIYMIGVAIYFGWVEIAQWKLDRIRTQLGSISESYTNTMQLKEQVRVMNNQLALQFAALNCWKAAADYLPPELTLNQFNFERGRKVTYYGLVNTEHVQKVNDFYDRMREAKVNDQLLFTSVSLPNINPRPPSQSAWSFSCELAQMETE